MDCHYHFGILDLKIVIPTLVSYIYGLSLPLWYLRCMDCHYHFGILDLLIVITTFLDLWIVITTLVP